MSSSKTTYANIITASKGVAPLYDPPRSKDPGRCHPDYGSGGLMKSWAQTFSAKSTAILNLPQEECPDLYPAETPTMQVSIIAKGQPKLRGHIIRQLISNQQIHLLNYGRADTWFFSSQAFDVTTMHNTYKTHGPYTLHFTLYEKNKINGTLRWVPPTLNNATLMQALSPYSNKEPLITTIPYTNNRSFSIYTNNPTTIPHYIQIIYKDNTLNILIAIAGRKQVCQICSSNLHWTNQCQETNLLIAQNAPSNEPTTSTEDQTTPNMTTAEIPSSPPKPSSKPTTSTKDKITCNITTKDIPNKKPISPSKPSSEPTTSNTGIEKPPIVKPPATTTLGSDLKLSSTLIPSTNTTKPILAINNLSPKEEMNACSNPKRKKEDSPTDTKQTTKSLKTTKLVHEINTPTETANEDMSELHYCVLCDLSFNETAAEHIDKVHSNIFDCRICKEKKPEDILSHFANKHPNDICYKCSYCEEENRICLSKELFYLHSQANHPNNDPAYDKVYCREKKGEVTFIFRDDTTKTQHKPDKVLTTPI
jgi:hypothetical protein